MVKSPYPREVYERNAEIYRVMANPKRLEILNTLRHSGPVTVQELVQSLGAKKANVSQHLAVLRSYRLVRAKRNGLNVIYSISDPRIVEPCGILKSLFEQPVK